MRTNIDLNDDLMREAAKFSVVRTKRGLIEEALTVFIQVKNEEQARDTYQERLQRLDRRLSGLTLRSAPSDILRQDRDR
jgi:Arc/MetJ family transcription regulator